MRITGSSCSAARPAISTSPKWNLVTKIRDGVHRPLVVVVFRSETKTETVRGAETAVRWVWENYRWVKAK